MSSARHMAWLEGVRMALGIVRTHPLRSALLILGVAIGVATLLAISTIVGGLSGKIRDDIVSAAKPYLYVSRYDGLGGDDVEAKLRRPQIGPECAEALRGVEGADQIDYMISTGSMTILTHEDKRTNLVQIFGSSEVFASAYSFGMDAGRFFTAQEVAAHRRVCVLGDGPRNALFPHADPVGESLRIEGRAYEIVGAMESRRHVLGEMGDNFVVMPWTSFGKDFSNEDNEDRTLAVTLAEGHDLDTLRDEVIGVLRRVRGLRPAQENDFDVTASETYGEMVSQITAGVALVLVILSSIGLMVGGIGVMNIMLISVTERTREIGVRMALGARRRDVLRQILYEASVLTGLGGVLGVGLGYLVAWAGTKVLAFPFAINPVAVIVALLFSVAIGIFFGLYPANRAARMDPIEALRHE